MEKMLVDSTYLLPILGVSVSGVDEVLLVLENLYRSNAIEIYYTHFSILEIMGKLTRMKYDLGMVEDGLNSIMENFRPAFPTTRSYLKALELRSMGFRDLMDLLLYTTALENNLKMLTRDKELVEFLERIGEKSPNTIILEDEFLETHP